MPYFQYNELGDFMKRVYLLLVSLALLVSAASAQVEMGSSTIMQITNDGTTGTTIANLAKINSSGVAIKTGTSDANIPVFIVADTNGTTGVAYLATGGTALCQADAGGGTAGNFVINSTATAGRCRDGGTTQPTTGCWVGVWVTSPSANSNGTVAIAPGCNPSNNAITVASGTSALGTSAISSGACATVVTTSATGAATTDVIDWVFNADPTSTTGYQASANGMLTIVAYPTSNNVNFKVCNNTSSSVTPGAVTLNWRVGR